MAELEAMLRKRMVKAMDIVNGKSLIDMQEETFGFYAKGNPEQYQRTGALGGTPNTTALSVGGDSASFDAYLDTGYNYSTGTWSAAQVVDAAEKGAGGILGKSGFWKRSEKKIEKTLNKTMRSFFK